MPQQFNTGSPQWDQALSSVFGAIPDPSKQAEAYYYGTQARKNLTDAAQIRDQSAAGHDVVNQVYTQDQSAPTYKQDPATGMYIQNDVAARYPGPGAAPAAAPGGAPATPSLAAAVAPMPIPGQGAPPGDPRASINMQVSPQGQVVPQQHWVPPVSTPAQTMQKLATNVENSPGAPLPPASPPTEGAPPAPNTTLTNGGTATGQQGSLSGVISPASISTGGGGTIHAPPAAHNGSQSPLGLDMAKLTAMQIQAHVPADQIYAQNKAVIMQAVATGRITQSMADDLLASAGEASSHNQRLANQSAQTVANIDVAGRQGVADTSARSAADVARIDVGGRQGVADTSAKSAADVARIDVTGRQGVADTTAKSALDVSRANADNAYEKILLADGKTVVAHRVGDPMPQGASVYDAGVASVQQTQGGALSNYMDPKNPGVPVYTDAETAKTQHLVAYPSKPGEMDEMMKLAISSETDPAARQKLMDRYTAFAALPKGEVNPDVFHKQQQNDYITDQRLYPRPAEGKLPTGLTNPIAFRPDAQKAIDDRVALLAMPNNPGRAHEVAIQQLQDEGVLPSVDQVNEMRDNWGKKTYGALFGNPKLSPFQPVGGKAENHLMIGTIKPEQQKEAVPEQQKVVPEQQKKPVPEQQKVVPEQTAQPSPFGEGTLGGLITSGLGAQSSYSGPGGSRFGAPTPLGPAPPGAVEGSTSPNPRGGTFVVHNGYVFAGP